jgi:hypothetical protein
LLDVEGPGEGAGGESAGPSNEAKAVVASPTMAPHLVVDESVGQNGRAMRALQPCDGIRSLLGESGRRRGALFQDHDRHQVPILLVVDKTDC